jgi:hypothetical protein
LEIPAVSRKKDPCPQRINRSSRRHSIGRGIFDLVLSDLSDLSTTATTRIPGCWEEHLQNLYRRFEEFIVVIMAALERPKIASYEEHESVWVDTEGKKLRKIGPDGSAW